MPIENPPSQLPPATQAGPGDVSAAPSPKPAPNEGHLWTRAALARWLKTAVDSFLTIEGTTWAASFAYYAFFALFPLLLVFVTLGTDIATRFVGRENARQRAFQWTVEKVETYMPLSSADRQRIRDTIEATIKARGSIGSVAMIGLLWSSLGFFQALVGALNKAWGHKSLNWWKLPLKNLLMLVILGAMLLVGVITPALLKTVQAYVVTDGVLQTVFVGLVSVVVPIGALFLGFLLFYKLAPRRRCNVTFSLVWLPALVVTASLQVLQQLFVFYSTHITNFNAIYGTFGGVIALMLWTYLSGMVIIFGGCLCAAMRTIQTPA